MNPSPNASGTSSLNRRAAAGGSSADAATPPSGHRMASYGAAAKNATATSYCGIGTDLVEFVCDSNRGNTACSSRACTVGAPAGGLRYLLSGLRPAVHEEPRRGDRGQGALLVGAEGKRILYVPEVHIV